MQKGYRKRVYYTDADKELMWDRWQAGESLHATARLFDGDHPSIHGIFARSGGIRPAKRRRPRSTLTMEEREEISRGIVAERSLRSIAAELGRSPSTISRELRRNGGRRRYRANQADKAAWDRAKRPKPCKLSENRALARIVARKLQLEWAPEQIAGWLKRTHPGDEAYQVSHEFESVSVISLVLTPLELYGTGDLAYEVGTQELTIEPTVSEFAGSRKYVHVFRRGSDGEWRFAALMSNNN